MHVPVAESMRYSYSRVSATGQVSQVLTWPLFWPIVCIEELYTIVASIQKSA